jgi:hypothetical protein
MDRRASSALRHGTAAHDAGQNFHVTAGCCATKDVVQAAFTRAAAAGTARGVGAPPPLVPPGREKNKLLILHNASFTMLSPALQLRYFAANVNYALTPGFA